MSDFTLPLQRELIQQACNALSQESLVVIPTETVYGLAGDATSDSAVASIYATKGRPHFNPLIIHVDSLEKAQEIAIFSPLALKIAQHFWPGPLTLILPRQPLSKISLLASAGLNTVALRIPAHPLALQLLKSYGHPLAAPSANRSNHLSPTCADTVRKSLGAKTPLILEGGLCEVGLESTILDLSDSEPHLLRPGGLSQEILASFLEPLGESLHKEIKPSSLIKSPGMLKRHYAPDRPLRLNATCAQPGEAFLAFGNPTEMTDLSIKSTKDTGKNFKNNDSKNSHRAFTNTPITYNLSPKGCVQEAAAHLFRYLYACDKDPFTGIAVAPIPLQGLGLAINDRLKRAAASSNLL